MWVTYFAIAYRLRSAAYRSGEIDMTYNNDQLFSEKRDPGQVPRWSTCTPVQINNETAI